LRDIGLHGVTCQFRADIAEMTKSMGFKGVGSNRPCFLCDCMYDTMFDLPPSLSSPTAWKNTDQTTYNDRLAQSIIIVMITLEDHGPLCGSSVFDERTRGPGGRCMKAAVYNCGPHKNGVIPKGARLIPHGDVPDYHALEQLTGVPCHAAIFRKPT